MRVLNLSKLKTRRICFERLEPRHMMASVTGDYDSSGLVDGGDYNSWQASFGEAGEVGELDADGNRNNVVDATDYVVWRKNLGMSLNDVPPDAPLGVAAAVSGPTSVQITWQAVAGATSYDVQRRRPNVANDPLLSWEMTSREQASPTQR